MHFPAFLFVLAVIIVRLWARTANRTAQQAFDAMSHSGYGYGSGYQDGGFNYHMNTAMNTAEEGFTPTDFFTTNHGDDYATSGQSNPHIDTGTYQEAPPFPTEYELPGSHDEGTFQAHGIYATTHNSMGTASFPVKLFLARQGSWNQVAPLRHNTLFQDTWELENLLGDQTLNMQPQDYSSNATRGDNSTAPMDHSFALQDSTGPNFAVDTHATEDFLEPVPGLQAQPGGQLQYPSHLDLGSDTVNPDAKFPQDQYTTATAAGPPFKCAGCARLWETKTQLK